MISNDIAKFLSAQMDLFVHLGYAPESLFIERLQQAQTYFTEYEDEVDEWAKDPEWLDKYRLLVDELKQTL